MRALVVDDFSAMRAILGMTLKRKGFEILQAKDGLDALGVLSAQWGNRIDPDRLEHAGDERPGTVATDSPSARVCRTQILMVTTETGIGEMSDAISAGANEYIMKPFTAGCGDGQAGTVGTMSEAAAENRVLVVDDSVVMRRAFDGGNLLGSGIAGRRVRCERTDRFVAARADWLRT